MLAQRDRAARDSLYRHGGLLQGRAQRDEPGQAIDLSTELGLRSRHVFDPLPGGGGPDSDRFGPFLKTLAAEEPNLDVRVLCWRSSLPIAATQNFFPIADRVTFRHSRVKFVLDGKLPSGLVTIRK